MTQEQDTASCGVKTKGKDVTRLREKPALQVRRGESEKRRKRKKEERDRARRAICVIDLLCTAGGRSSPKQRPRDTEHNRSFTHISRHLFLSFLLLLFLSSREGARGGRRERGRERERESEKQVTLKEQEKRECSCCALSPAESSVLACEPGRCHTNSERRLSKASDTANWPRCV